MQMPLVYIHSEQSKSITYSSSVTVCFTRNIFELIFVTVLCMMIGGMCMVVYTIVSICMYRR